MTLIKYKKKTACRRGAAVTSPSHPAPPLFALSRTSRARTLTRAACPAHTRRTIPRGAVRFPPSCSGRSRPTPRPSHPGRERRAPVSNAGINIANRKPASCRRLEGAGSRAGVITRVKRAHNNAPSCGPPCGAGARTDDAYKMFMFCIKIRGNFSKQNTHFV